MYIKHTYGYIFIAYISLIAYIYVSTSRLVIHISSFFWRGLCRYTWELLHRVSLNGRYALMIQLISPAAMDRPRTMAKIGGWGRGGRVRLKGQEEFRNRVVGRAPWRASAGLFVSLFVSTLVCMRGTPKGTKERVETAAHHVMPPRKNPRDSDVFCERALRARNFIAARNSTRTISSSTKSRVVYREIARPDRSACMPHAIPRSS